MAEEKDIEERDEEFESGSESKEAEDVSHVIQVSGMYENWFLDYASYVILERAVPHVNDGLKPVQRRILHSMKEMDDGRYNKVANIVGNTMKYHPHGDASITDALVGLGQKDLLIDTQGNWGNVYTGDRAAAARYIEARLSKFALEVVFNAKTTEWQASYDGRNKEPVTQPVKFPLLLAQGVEGIAVGLSCKVLPHNFNELIDNAIKHLQGKRVKIYPDFPTAGMIDVSNYNEGARGGRIRVRARINKPDKKSLQITEIPFGTTTTSLIDSIIKANDKGKIKIKRIEDNTAEHVDILIQLAPNVSPDKTIDALYAFTNCEMSISPNAVVIEDDKPRFVGVHEILQMSVDHTKDLLQLELEIRKRELEEQWHFASLEKIFIEKRIYRDIEEAETWEEIISFIHKGLKPHIKHLLREVTDEDVAKLTEIKIKRISKFDSFKADEHIAKLEEQIEQTKHHLAHLVDYAIDYFKNLKKKFGEGRERKTEIKSFETIERSKVAVNNAKLYVNLKEGFAGYALKRGEGEFVKDCSDIDDIIVIRKDGIMTVSKIQEKAFFGKDIIHIDIWKKGDKRTIYNLVYQDGAGGRAMVKRFAVDAVTRDREYDLCGGKDKSRILYLTANPNGEAEVIRVILRPKPKLKNLKFDFDFKELAIKGRGAKGNILSKNIVHKIELKEEGVSTLGARKIWFDDTVHRLNTEGRGNFVGEFKGEDRILTIMQTGEYVLSSYALATKFDEDYLIMERFDPEKVYTLVYFDGDKEQYNVKRFNLEATDKKQSLITEHEKSHMEFVSAHPEPKVLIKFDKRSNDREDEEIDLAEFISVKGQKAMGNRLTSYKVKSLELIEPELQNKTEEPDDEENSEEEVKATKTELSENTEAEVADAPAEEKEETVEEEKEKNKSEKKDEVKQEPEKEEEKPVAKKQEEPKEEKVKKSKSTATSKASDKNEGKAKMEENKAPEKKAGSKDPNEGFSAGNQITLDL